MKRKDEAPVDETAPSFASAAQAGDSAAFDELVRAYDQSVLRLAMNHVTIPRGCSGTCIRKPFLRVYRNLGQFRFDCSFHTWLYRIVTNLCLDQLRKRKIRKEEPTVLATADGTLDRIRLGTARRRASREILKAAFVQRGRFARR